MIKIFGIRFTSKAEKERQHKIFVIAIKTKQAQYIIEHDGWFNRMDVERAVSYLASLLEEDYA